MKRKVLPLIIVLAMLLTIMVGCVKTEQPPKDGTEDQTSVEPGAKEDETAPGKEEEKFLSNEERFSDIKGTTITIIGEEPGTNDDQEERIAFFEEKYGAKVEVYVGKDNEELIFTLLAAGTPPDIVNLTNTRLFSYIQMAALLPLEDLMDVRDPVFNQPLVDTCTWRGHVYGVNGDPLVKGYYVNKTMFENNGLETPYSLYKKGEWNWTTFKEAAMALTQDTNKDDVIDVWGVNINMGDLTIFPQSNGADWLIVDKSEPKITFGLDDPKAIEALQFVQDGLVKDKCFTTELNKKNWPTGELAMTYESYGAIRNWLNQGLSFDWEFVPFPSGPSGDGAMPGTIGRFGVPRGAKNPEGGAAYIYSMNLLSSQSEGGFKEFYDPEVWEELMKLRKIEFIPNNKIIASDAMETARKTFEDDLKAGVPVATILEKVKPLYQTAIGEFLDDEKSAWDNLNK